ncbi:MAG: P-II family nitrogen regulator [Eubacteriales bacterium]
MQNIYLFITIVRKADEREFTDFLLSHGAAPIYASICQGSANSKTLDLLGLEKSEKMMIQSIVPHNKISELKMGLIREMEIDRPGRGIALAAPLSSLASRQVLKHIIGDETEENVINERKTEMELIVSICAKGHSDEIIDAAREAGAQGGTIVKAKGTAAAGTNKFFGMSISDEKEITYIVAKKEIRSDIMKAIAGFTYADGAHPIVFSLPVTETAGFRLFD